MDSEGTEKILNVAITNAELEGALVERFQGKYPEVVVRDIVQAYTMLLRRAVCTGRPVIIRNFCRLRAGVQPWEMGYSFKLRAKILPRCMDRIKKIFEKYNHVAHESQGQDFVNLRIVPRKLLRSSNDGGCTREQSGG